MASIKFSHLGVLSAEQFKESVSESTPANVYLTFGRSEAWANDASPPQANTMPATFVEVWDKIIGGKKLTGFDISHVIPYNRWVANTVYTEYDDLNPNLFLPNVQFYVVTSDFNVYKCISNNYGAASTEEPTDISTSTISQTGDGYYWKYMYTIDGAGQLKYTTDNYVPVKKLTGDDGSAQWDVQSSATEGAIYNIKIVNAGTNYSNSSNLVVTITGDGTGANCVLGINSISNVVNSVIVTSYGSGYHFADVTVSGGGGSDCSLRAIISPPGGHGSEPLYELNGSKLLLNVRLNSVEDNKFSIENNFRQIALIKEPLIYGTSNQSSNSVISQTMDLTVTGTGPEYIEDELVYQGASVAEATFKGKVLSYSSSNNLLKVVDTFSTPSTETLYGANSTATRFVSSIVNPDLEKYTGQLLYVDNVEPIERNIDQIEDIKIVISL